MFRAIFIGVDKHADPGIRELGGAVRDATALWALFTDTFGDSLNPTLLINEAATAEAIEAALRDTVTTAGPDDLVVITFSGHGTKDHRLVAYDTSKANLANTTISVDTLVDVFKRSRAKAIVLVLDCCFSGAAPGRVLEDSPIARNPGFPIEQLAGAGKLIISACGVDEVAWESPTSRHGLLTKALIESLQSDDPVNLISAMGRVVDAVRAAASALGMIQTPVMLGYVEGGLSLPQLKRGKRFDAAFPEIASIHVGRSFDEMRPLGLPRAALDAWKERYPAGLNDLQLQAVNDHHLLDGASLVVVAPTSSGKTFIGELAALRAVSEGRKAVFLLSHRALVNEKFEDFDALYGAQLGWRVIRCTGDYTDQTHDFVRARYDIALLTFEMFLNLAVAQPSILNDLGLVVLDEAQHIADPERGISVELLLALLKAARERGVSPQLLALSAVIGNVNDFHEWLGCSLLRSDVRPVPLIEGVLDRYGTFQYRDTSGDVLTEQLLPPHEIHTRHDKPSAQDVIVPLVRRILQRSNEKVIVFRNTRGYAAGCAGYLADELGLAGDNEAVTALPERDGSSLSGRLRTALENGTAFHTKDLNRAERLAVERSFRKLEGGVRVLAATTTVAAGVNTPASTVIIPEHEFFGAKKRLYSVAEYKNMAGRAGRLGFSEVGRAILLANDPTQREVLFARYVQGQLDPLKSSFDVEQLETWFVRLLGHVHKVQRSGAVNLLLGTYGGFLATRAHPGWAHTIADRLETVLVRMLDLGLLEAEGEYIRLTLLGSACAQSSMALPSAMRLVDLLRQHGKHPTPIELVAFVQVVPEADGGFTPLLPNGTKEATRIQQAIQRSSGAIVASMQRFVDSVLDYWARCKRLAILMDWTRGVDVEEIERTYSTTPFKGSIRMATSSASQTTRAITCVRLTRSLESFSWNTTRRPSTWISSYAALRLVCRLMR
jgi:helicase